jgi:RNA polymerase sigma-70 factor, ECF subfamily
MITGSDDVSTKHTDAAVKQAFLASAGAADSLRRLPNLDRRLREMIEAGRHAWADLVIDAAAFVAYAAERLPVDDAAAALEKLYAADLYLACGCASGAPVALRLFERHIFSQVPLYLSGADVSAIDETLQLLRIRMLGTEPGRPPQITQYRGSGPLGGWMRVAAVRTHRNLLRAQRAHLQLDDQRDGDVRADHPELALLKRRHAGTVNEVFAAVLRGLPPDERNMLSLRFLDGLSTDAIADLLRLDGSTVRRRLTKLRERILDETRAALGERLRVNESECESLIAIVRSQMAVSVARNLR